MSDLVERLRDRNRVADARTRRELREAADKIERMQQAIRHCPHCGQSWFDDGLTGGCSCHTIKQLQADNERLQKLLRQFGSIHIPDNWPGHCKLRIDKRIDGSECIAYHGDPEKHLGILPQICYWRQAREAAEAAGGSDD